MRSYFAALIGLVLFLSACSSNLLQESTDLEAQRVRDCTFQGAVYDGSPNYTDISANCYIIADGYDTLEVRTSIERASSGSGSYTSVGFTDKVYSRSGSGNISISHNKATASACSGNYSWRGKMLVRWVDGARNEGGRTTYYTPVKLLNCP